MLDPGIMLMSVVRLEYQTESHVVPKPSSLKATCHTT